jgi:hypothetical protein
MVVTQTEGIDWLYGKFERGLVYSNFGSRLCMFVLLVQEKLSLRQVICLDSWRLVVYFQSLTLFPWNGI